MTKEQIKEALLDLHAVVQVFDDPDQIDQQLSELQIACSDDRKKHRERMQQWLEALEKAMGMGEVCEE